MAIQELRDRSGKLLGWIRQMSDGKLELRNAAGVFKGIYDPKRNETRNAASMFVGRGNLLSSLL